MARYQFQSADGEVVEVERPMTNAPKIGSTITRGGVVYRRVPSRSDIRVKGGTPRTRGIQAWSLPNRRTMDERLKPFVSGWNAQGAPCFETTEQADRFCTAERKLVDKAGAGQFHTFGDNGPDAADLDDGPVKLDK